ncbi:hypothetical protein F5B19DRAFT_495179 [Rostrohypoxylon terebratum]|nr:hypothetical protein F5B19DRAFT_495179 [Rostrohypoxylon terebratum]
MNAYFLVAQALFRVVPHVNIALFGGNDSSAIEPAVSITIFANSPANVLTTPAANNPDIILTSASRYWNSVPPRITIDTVIAAVRPQEITEIDSKGITTSLPAPTAPTAPTTTTD